MKHKRGEREKERIMSRRQCGGKNAILDWSSFTAGMKDCLPTVFGYLSIGFAAGVIGRTAGLSVAEIALMSVMVYAGSAQFIMSGMLASGSSLFSITLTVFFVNLRHLLMSAALSPYFRHLPAWKNGILGAQLTDETFAVASAKLGGKEKGSGSWMLGLNMTAQINWLLATVAGAIFGQWIADPHALGLNFALPAMFVGLIVMQLVERRRWKKDLEVALSAALLAVAGSVLGSGSAGLIIAVIIAATIGAWREWK
jgi:4-azaleucine resistance transporter AzlC